MSRLIREWLAGKFLLAAVSLAPEMTVAWARFVATNTAEEKT